MCDERDPSILDALRCDDENPTTYGMVRYHTIYDEPLMRTPNYVNSFPREFTKFHVEPVFPYMSFR